MIDKIKKFNINQVIKILFILSSILFVLPSIIYLIKNGTVLGFDKWYCFLLNNTNRNSQTLIYLIILTIMTILYCIIIKKQKELFKNIRQILIYTAIVSSIYLLSISFMSSDIFYYLGIGRIDSKYNQNPYYTTITDFVETENNRELLEEDKVLEQGYINVWADTTVVYGPLWTIICKIIAIFSFGNIDLGVFVFRLANILIHILNCYLIYKISNKKIFAVIYGLNPYMLIEGIMGVHNDIFVISFILLGLYFLLKKKNLFMSVICLAMSCAIKYFAIILLPLFVIYHFKDEKLSKEKIEQEKTNFQDVNNQMEQIARKIDYDEYFFKMDEIKLQEKYDYRHFKEDIKRYITKIDEGKKALETEKTMSNEYEIALENLDREKREKAKQDEVTNKARNELQANKENFIEDMYTWERENSLLKLNQEEMSHISQKVNNYGEGAEYGDIVLALNVPYNNKTQELLNEKASKLVQKDNFKKQIQELEEQIEEWKSKKEPEPIITEKVKENRKKLKEKNIPYVELYNAIDFKPDLDEQIKNKIESALLDMGILNALIIPKEYREKIKQIDIDFVDKYLYENPLEFKHDLSHLLNVKLSQDSNIKEETVYNVLKSIMIEDKTANTYVNEKGEYKIGILQGIADKDEKAKFIGTEARKEFKQKQIQKLEEEKLNLQIEKDSLEKEIEQIDEKIEKIKEEYNKFPKKEELENAYNNLRININKLEAIKQNITKLEDVLAEKFEKLKQAKEEVKVRTAKLPFALTLEAYTENLERANELKDFIYDMEKYHNNYINEYEKILVVQETLENLRYDLDDVLYQKGKITVKIKTLKGKIETIKQMAEVSDLEKQMEECLEKLDKLPKERDKLSEDIGREGAEIQKLEENELTINSKLNSLQKQTEIAKEILKQELDLKYVIEEYEEINKITRKILDDYAYFDKESKDISSYFETLIEKYRENSEKLLDYNLEIGRIFIKELEDEEEEIKEIEKTRTRSDITCFVNGRRINLNNLKEYIEETIEETKNLVDDEDRHLFEEILIGAVGRKIRERIYSAKAWVDSMNKLMRSLNTSSGLSFSLNWKPKLAIDENEIDTKEIVDILNSDMGLLRQSDIKKVATHFRTKFAKAEKEFTEKGAIVPFYNIIKETLDYRKWFEFQFMYKKSGEQSKELTNNAFYKLSGGEKAMAMYIPLFASVCARYQSARKDCLRIISLDEAFAGVDDNNIRDMFRILTELDLEYIINSQVLWGEYDTVPSLSICELISDVNRKVVSVMRYHWNGKKRELLVEK